MKRMKNSKNTNESKISKGKTEEALISSLIDKTFSLKVIQAVIFPLTTTNKTSENLGTRTKN